LLDYNVLDSVEALSKKLPQIEVTKYNIISEPQLLQPFEITDIGKVTRPILMKHRVFALRSPYYRDLFYKRSLIRREIHRTFTKWNFTEIESPKIINQSLENVQGGSEVFRIDYYGQIKTLTQSPQMFKQICVNMFDKVYELSTVFRAEKSDSSKHLAEISCLDFEIVTDKMDDITDCITILFKNIIKNLNLNFSPEDLSFPSYNYKEVCKILNKQEGTDFTNGEQKQFSIDRPKFYYITHYPTSVRPFYTKSKNGITESFDLYYEDIELASGSLREENYNILLEKLKAHDINTDNFEQYLENFKYGSKPHGGAGLGIDRILQCLCNVNDITDTVLFPRSYTVIA
jgi:aspartyl/asparaginyl-tRNA synthetase